MLFPRKETGDVYTVTADPEEMPQVSDENRYNIRQYSDPILAAVDDESASLEKDGHEFAVSGSSTLKPAELYLLF